MAIQNWSDEITVVELADDPQFTDELNTLMDQLESNPTDVVLNFAAVSFINSSNIAKLLRLRKAVMARGKQLMFCDVNSHVWGIIQITGLDKIFEFTNDIATALATLQMANQQQAGD